MATEAQIQWVRFPLIALHSRARAWLQIQANLGLAHNTIEAYGRALEDYLKFSSNSSLNIEAATQEHISQYVHHLTNKPQLSETNVRRIDSKAGLANATIQQRLTAVRLYYDYLVEEGIRKTNPVGRGKYTPGKGFAGNRERSLVRRYTKLPWIPNEEQWLQIVQAAKAEPLRNRVMFALAYDSALRREELCSLQIGDINPALRTIVIRAENTKSRWERITPYSQTTSALLANYFNHRKTISRAPGAVFLSESHRNHAASFRVDVVKDH